MIKGLSLLQLLNSVEFSISAKLSICLTLLENISERNQFFKIKLFITKCQQQEARKEGMVNKEAIEM